METLRILFYADSHDFTFGEDDLWSLLDVKDFITLKLKRIAKVTIDLVQRHPVNPLTQETVQGGNKLTKALLSAYDEIWFFNYAQMDGKPCDFYELTEPEIYDLRDWMDTGGGVLVTGDHSLPSSIEPDPTHASYITLGRALCHKIPRAGKFRTWVGPPTSENQDPPLEERDNYNTQEGTSDLDNPKFEADGLPQLLRLKDPAKPHLLFSWRLLQNNTFEPIQFFPDHSHEGQLIIPALTADEWPAHSPVPEIIAWGSDKRPFNPKREYPIVAVFDGDPAGVGRIVADSSFHHYTKNNLNNIPDRCCGKNLPDSESALDQIAQFYGNLAYWLAPNSFRAKVAQNLLFRIARNPNVFEVRGSSLAVLGTAALYAITSHIGKSNVQRILSDVPEGDTNELNSNLSSLSLLGRTSEFSLLPTEHVNLLGAIIQGYHEEFRRQGINDPAILNENPLSMNGTMGVLRDAFLQQHSTHARLNTGPNSDSYRSFYEVLTNS
ncbi:MAG TPA: hypothetical protein VI306_21885 [Pyrinomonadaceae bacterium]